MVTAPTARSPLPFFAARQSYPLTLTQSPSTRTTPIHRPSLLPEHTSGESIFINEICHAEGRRWILRTSASRLPGDMVHVLEELEKRAVELGLALPKMVVTCSAEILSMKQMERGAAAVKS